MMASAAGAVPQSRRVALRRTGTVLGVVAGVSSVLTGCAANPSATTDPILNDPASPYTETICGQVWQPGRAVPAISPLVRTSSPAPVAPARSDLPGPKPGIGPDAAFKLGDCETGAIVTISPKDAAFVQDVFNAKDGSVAFLTLSFAGKQSFVLRAWSSRDGSYLGEFKGPQ